MATMTPVGTGYRLNPNGPMPREDPNKDPNNPAPPPPIRPKPPVPTVITAEADPGLTDVAGMTRDYIKGIPGNVGELTDVAGGKIRDVYEGAYKGNRVSASRRGVLGSGVEGALNDRTTDDLTAALTSSATDIALGGHKQAGDMLSNLANQEAQRAAAQQAQQRIALDTRRTDLEAERNYQDQLQALTGLYERRQPREYYDDSNPESAAVPGAGVQGGLNIDKYSIGKSPKASSLPTMRH